MERGVGSLKEIPVEMGSYCVAFDCIRRGSLLRLALAGILRLYGIEICSMDCSQGLSIAGVGIIVCVLRVVVKGMSSHA